ncbi:hypothetical protein [Pseudomonas sp. URMO17WK12:I11]|uniref:hypothetical protein n=1 Tax=Pseudomonas sp. URMO17WK12:I11 TaxID=1283291 RepID=UPI00119D864D|nr:hypothetical protein [Pseudomonas sp. URMO17WK12:I11]
MSNEFDGYRVFLERQGNAVDATMVLDVKADGFHASKYEVLRVWYWVDECGELNEIERSVCKYVSDYKEDLIDLVKKAFNDHDKTGYDTETDQDAGYYACEYEAVIYASSPELRQEVVNQVVENDGHYER